MIIALVAPLNSPTEQQTGVPLTGSSGLLLERTLSRGGIKLSEFTRWSLNDGKPLGYDCIVLCGPEAVRAYTGYEGDLQDFRGYPIWDQQLNCWLMPTMHPDFMRQGHSDFGTVILHDFARALQLRGERIQQSKCYYLDPDQLTLQWLHKSLKETYKRNRIAFDIETPWKSEDESELDVDSLGVGQRKIDRIGFSWRGHFAVSVEWNEDNLWFIKEVLALPNEKIVWNESFDVPIIRGNGVEINGPIHDGMVMWHILHPGLPKKLGFVATFLCPDQERWKHLSGAKPAFYNATDADVEWRCVDECERQLKAAGRWHVYEQQIMAVKKPLSFMSKMGMPVDPEKRLDAAHRLEQLLDSNFTAVQQATKDSTARKRERKKPRQVPKGGEMTTEIVLKEVWQCDTCGLYGFAKSKHTKKVCGMGSKPEIVKVVASVDVPVLIHPFNANSPKQIVDYCREHKYDVPMKRDKDGNFKPTTDEKAIKILRAKYPDDPLFPHILHKRKLEKLAGTYIGRLEWNLEDGTVKVVGGMPMDKNYLVHTNYNDNPSTGRLGSNDPNMQNLPNPNRI